jgi:Fe-S-cluster containining protein
MIALPQVEPCTACGGGCCRSIGRPPFECLNPDLGTDPRLAVLDEFAQTPELLPDRFRLALADARLFAAMPADVRAAHADSVRGLAADPSGTPCAWLDGSGRCRHYEWRPHVCRVWPVGNPDCLDAWRNGLSVVFRGDGSVTQFTDPLAPRPADLVPEGVVVPEPAPGGP